MKETDLLYKKRLKQLTEQGIKIEKELYRAKRLYDGSDPGPRKDQAQRMVKEAENKLKESWKRLRELKK